MDRPHETTPTPGQTVLPIGNQYRKGNTPMTTTAKTYANKSNARRAAKAAGIQADEIVIGGTEGAHTFSSAVVEPPVPVELPGIVPGGSAAPEPAPAEEEKPAKAKKAAKTPKHETQPDGLREDRREVS